MSKHFVSNNKESVRMFKSDFIEMFSKVHWSVPLIIYIPVITYFIYKSIAVENIGIILTVLLFAFGVLGWSFTEYVLHRFVFHYHPKTEFGKRLHWTFHGVHHDYPQDMYRLVMPPSISIPLAFLFYFIFIILFGPAFTPAIFAGLVAGYLAYDTVHYAVHHFAFRNKVLLNIKKHHMKHHYIEPDEGFGVSSPLWDYVFRTKSVK
ncbi:MAG: sterol desaturase family protein [Candidatus Kapabacteria bacterium]|jgi:sterol desaturase/sphingolipid hydroxylase (fatty acid hydroxylase superfamily)|nr:sterol desaturase family protein [Candidatus Kapabacteria bacterium]